MQREEEQKSVVARDDGAVTGNTEACSALGIFNFSPIKTKAKRGNPRASFGQRRLESERARDGTNRLDEEA